MHLLPSTLWGSYNAPVGQASKQAVQLPQWSVCAWSYSKSKSKISSLTKSQTRISIMIIGMLFFIFGFVSWANAILLPYFKIACELTNFKAYLVTFAFYISYFIMSVPASLILSSIGFKKGMMLMILGYSK